MKTTSPNRFHAAPSILIGFCLAAPAFLPRHARAWGIHPTITEAALELLPDPERAEIRKCEAELVRRYCIFPDVAKAADAIPYLIPFPAEAKVSMHIPASIQNQRTLFEAYVPKILGLLKSGETVEAMRFFGSLAHFLEDSSAPCHMAYGEMQVPSGTAPLLVMDFFKRFMPRSENIEADMLHARIDKCAVGIDQLRTALKGRGPQLLGHSEQEMIFNLLEQHWRMNERSSRLVFPMMQALSEGDEAQFVALGTEAAAGGAALVADALHTLLCIAQSRFDDPPPAAVSLAGRVPAATGPFEWTDPNHVGTCIPDASGSLFRNMGEPPGLGRQPLRLTMPDGSVRAFEKGFGVGFKTSLTFAIPRGVFARFTAHAGNDAGLGALGTNIFEVLLDGRPAAATQKLCGAAPAERIEIPLGDAASLTLNCNAFGPPKRTHGVWADPTLHR